MTSCPPLIAFPPQSCLLCCSQRKHQPFDCCQEAFTEKATFSSTAHHKGFKLDCKRMIKHVIIITATGLSCRFSLHKASCRGSGALARTAKAGAPPPSGVLLHGEAVAGEARAFGVLSPAGSHATHSLVAEQDYV